MALIKKYDWARLTASDVLSPSLRIESRILVASNDWMSKRGKLVVLLKARAGPVQLGSLSKRVAMTPMIIEMTLYPIDHTG
jgi:hypothetical protein